MYHFKLINMGKAIVIYNSRTGNTKKVAMKIAEGLGADCASLGKIPKLDEYKLIIVGSWVMMGRISFGGARLLRRLKMKGLKGKKIAMFFTSGKPDEIHPFTKDSENPKTIFDIMFTTMENKLGGKDITILEERFYASGETRMFKNSEPMEPIGHPDEKELAQALAFGEQLKKLC